MNLKRKKVLVGLLLVVMVVSIAGITGCSSKRTDTPIEPFFPVQKEVQITFMTALLQGELVLDNGCLRVHDVLVLWPHGYSWKTEGEGILIIDDKGQIAGWVGEQIKLGGGEVPAYFAEEKIGQPLPDSCPGPYWLAGEVVEEPSPQRNAELEELHEKYKDTPELFEAAIYARHFGVTVEEALRRFEVQDSFDRLEARLIENEPGTFAGLWIEHTPHRVVVAFTRDGEETIKQYISENQTGYIEVRTVKYSYAELLAAQSEVGAALRDLDITFDSAGYVQENRVEFCVTDRTPVDEAMRDGKLEVPDCVDIVTVKGLAQPD